MRRVFLVLAIALALVGGVLLAPMLGAAESGSPEPPPLPGSDSSVAAERAAPVPRSTAGPSDAKFVPINPARAFDSRQGAYPGSGPLTPLAKKVISIKDGHNNVGAVTVPDVVPAGATAIAYNLTIAEPTGPNWVSVTAGNATSGIGTSFLNYSAVSFELANAGVVPIDGSRQIALWGGTSPGSTHVIVDVTGYYVDPIFAHVSAAGALGLNSWVTSVTKHGTGLYQVNFPRDITGCVPSLSTFFNYGAITYDMNTATSIFVWTANGDTFVLADRSFDITMTC